MKGWRRLYAALCVPADFLWAYSQINSSGCWLYLSDDNLESWAALLGIGAVVGALGWAAITWVHKGFAPPVS